MRKQVAALIVLGVATRIFLEFAIKTPPIGGDAVGYIAAATLQPSDRVSIGYPLFIALPYWVGGPVLVLLIQTCLGIATGVVSYLLLRPHPTAFLTAAIIVSCPFVALYDRALLSEALYVPLVWVAWLLLGRKPLFAAAMLGLAALTRETLVLLPLCALPLVARRYWPAFAAASLMAVPALAQSRYGGMNLWVGTWERDSSWFDRTGINEPRFPPYAFHSDAERRAVMASWPSVPMSVAIERIATRPVETAAAWVRRFPSLWVGDRAVAFSFRFASMRGRLILQMLNIALLAAGLIGLARKPQFAVPVLYAGLVYAPFHAEMRYTLMAVPFLCYGAALSILSLRSETKTLQQRCQRTCRSRPEASS